MLNFWIHVATVILFLAAGLFLIDLKIKRAVLKAFLTQLLTIILILYFIQASHCCDFWPK